MLKNIKVTGNRCTFDLAKADVSLANALRRSLISDIETIAPYEIIVRKNTSCQPDEYIAHRISMIPFVYINDDSNDGENIEGKYLTLNVSDRTATTKDFIGTAFRTSYDCDIIKLIDEQTLDITVLFSKGYGREHAKYSPTCAVGYEESVGNINFSFESINSENPIIHLKKALQHMKHRLENVKIQVEK